MTTIISEQNSASLMSRVDSVLLRLTDRLTEHVEPYFAQPTSSVVFRGLGSVSGYALAFAGLAMGGYGDQHQATMHKLLALASQSQDQPDIGLYSGISGLRAAAAYCQRVMPRYAKLIDGCDSFVETRLAPYGELPMEMGDYDIISGWAGARLARCLREPYKVDGLCERLLWTISDEARWSCIHPVRVEEGPRNDLGMAHGVAGMLSALALTTEYANSHHQQHVVNAARSLAELRFERMGIVTWCNSSQESQKIAGRSAWCYGTPGIAMALINVGNWCGDTELVQIGVSALHQLALAPIDRWSLDDPAICHGYLGNALVFASAARIAENQFLHDAALRLVHEAVTYLEKSDGICYCKGPDDSVYSAFGELDGIAGIMNALLSLMKGVDSSWMRVHGISPIN